MAEDPDWQEPSPVFAGECSCPHPQWQHGWRDVETGKGCEVEGCDCQAGWEE